jgi:tRNA nucleotidyltransferase (CCA-adding enzyme)
MDLILCHQTADFDALGAAVGLAKLYPGAKIVLTGGAHPSVRDFLGLHRDEFPLIEYRSVNPQLIRRLLIVDTQKRDRLGKAQEWLSLDNVGSIIIYDHHWEDNPDLPYHEKYVEKIGSSTALICELLQQESISLNPIEATAMALGIHVDTGSLTFEQSTARDASALAWLMSLGVNLRCLQEYIEPSLSPQMQRLLPNLLQDLHTEIVYGSRLNWVLFKTNHFIPGLSNLTGRIRDLIETDVLLFAHYYGFDEQKEKEGKLTIIGRSRLESVNLATIFSKFRGGGHSTAASFNIRCHNPQEVLEQVVLEVKNSIATPLTARDIMSSPVRTIRPHTTIEEAQRILLRYGHSGLFVVNQAGDLQGVISRRDLDLALHHGFSHAPVKGYMTKNIEVIHPDTSLPDIEELMVQNDIGRLPVIAKGEILGIVTRTDILRQIHQNRLNLNNGSTRNPSALVSCLLPSFENHLHPPIWHLLSEVANYAQSKGWHLYLVGGGVRDLLLTGESNNLNLQDIDLVVDGFHQTTTTEAGVELAEALQVIYPQARLSVHGEFQTAALLWHNDEDLGSLWLDIATARTEFYPYPAANPEVESSSIRQDLYRRDFTINALAVRLTHPRGGELLDFFGGLADLRAKLIRVLHPNSFIEDPTRIYRAVRFAVRLNFELEPQTRDYIEYAIDSGVYEKVSVEKTSIPALTTRLKAELKHILQAEYWQKALKLLDEVNALRCLHQNCLLTPQLWWEIRCLDRWLKYYHNRQPTATPESWLLRLEIILASFAEGIKVAQNLVLPQNSIKRLQQIKNYQEKIKNKLNTCQTISEQVECLSTYPPLTLLIIAVKSDRQIRRSIWQYLMHWSRIKSPLNGEDLYELGYKPGRQYKEILNQIRGLVLDGKINGTKEAKEYILLNYPLT